MTILLRYLIILAGLSAIGCVLAYWLRGKRHYLTWALRILVVSVIVALVFFGVLIVERIQQG